MSAALVSAAWTMARTCSEAAEAMDAGLALAREAERRSCSTSSATCARCASTASGS